MTGALIERARRLAGLTQGQLAELAGTSRPTLSAYESGRKSPTLTTTERILAEAGHRLDIEPRVTFREVGAGRGRPFFVPDRLWRLDLEAAIATVELPLSVNWSDPGASFRLAVRRERRRCYEIVLREGMPADLLRFVDGALLIDSWRDLVLPDRIRNTWQEVIDQAV